MKDWLITYGSFGLAPFGLLGMYVVGRKKTWGWMLSMSTQALWATYAIGTGQYGFLIGTCSYFVIYLRNWLKWRKDAAPGADSQLEALALRLQSLDHLLRTTEGPPMDIWDQMRPGLEQGLSLTEGSLNSDWSDHRFEWSKEGWR